MHRLIVQLKEPLNASFCEAVVSSFGHCEIVPLTENYCVVEGFKMDVSAFSFEKILDFTRLNVNKAFLAVVNEDLDNQVHWLNIFPESGLLCSFEPPKVITYSKTQINHQLWCLSPWKQQVTDDFNEY